MDRKTLAIGVLVITGVLLTGVVIQGLMPAYGQAGRFSDYAMVPVATDANTEALCVMDTVTQRMIFFKYPPQGKTLEVQPPGMDLKKDFGRP